MTTFRRATFCPPHPVVVWFLSCVPLGCSYIGKVDVLKILVAANYKDIPSLDDILEPSAVTRLRNQLLEAEHYRLAVEVCVCVLCVFTHVRLRLYVGLRSL